MLFRSVENDLFFVTNSNKQKYGLKKGHNFGTLDGNNLTMRSIDLLGGIAPYGETLQNIWDFKL